MKKEITFDERAMAVIARIPKGMGLLAARVGFGCPLCGDMASPLGYYEYALVYSTFSPTVKK